MNSMHVKVLALLALLFSATWSVEPPELPGEEISESMLSLPRAQKLETKISSTKIDKPKWHAASVEEQLGLDPTLIGMGTGAIFVPTMTETRLEPEILVMLIKDGKLVNSSKAIQGEHGRRIIVPEGSYRVIIGSGFLQQRMHYDVEVKEGHTSLVEPDWGGMVVRIMDETGTLVEDLYEVFNVNTGESYGKGFGYEDSRENDLKTWILPAKTYKIVSLASDFSTISQYITVRVPAGELIYIDLVVDSETGAVIGGGEQPNIIRTSDDKNWKQSFRMGGALSFTNNRDVDNVLENVFNVNTDLKYLARYDDARWHYTGEITSLNNFQITKAKDQDESDVDIILDEFKLRSTLIRRINTWFGPYVRGTMKTHFARKIVSPKVNDSIMVLNIDKDTVRVLHDSDLVINKSFFPMEFGEGAGINLDIFSTPKLEVSSQMGAALRQFINKDVLVKFSDSSDVYIPLENQYEFGLEATIFMRALLTRIVTWDILAEIFIPEGKFKEYRYEELSSDLRIRVFRSIELSILNEVSDSRNTEETTDHRFHFKTSFTLRLFFNF